jgi:hypothetical protein
VGRVGMLGVDPLTLRSWDTAEPAPAERRRPDHDARSRVGQEGQARCGMAHPGGRGGRTCGRRDIRLVSMSRAFRRAPPPQPQLHSVSYPPLLASPPSNPSCFRDHSITALAFGLPQAGETRTTPRMGIPRRSACADTAVVHRRTSARGGRRGYHGCRRPNFELGRRQAGEEGGERRSDGDGPEDVRGAEGIEFVRGFRAGSHRVSPRCVRVVYSYVFDDISMCSTICYEM